MSRGKQLVKNTAIVAVGRICTKMLAFILLPFYTAVLSQQEYGIVDLFNTFTSLMIPVVVFQMEDAVFRFLIEIREDELQKRKLLSTTILFAFMQCVLFFAVFFLITRWVSIPYGAFLLGNILVTIFSGLFLQLARGLGDNIGYAIGSFITAAATILLNIILVLIMKMGVEGMFISIFFSNLLTVIYIFIKEKVFSYIRLDAFSFAELKKVLSYSFPLIPNYLCWWILGASDKSIVTAFLGLSANGILAVAQKFSTAYTTMYSVFNLTWTENAAMHLKDQDSERYFSDIIEKAFRILSCMCMGVVAIVAVFFPVLVNENFAEAYNQIPIYMLSAFLYSTIGIFSVVYIACKMTGKIAKTSFSAAAINLVVNLTLIQWIGLYAASISSVAAYAVLLAIRYYDIQKYLKVRISKKTILSVCFAMTGTFVVYYIRDNLLSAILLAGIVIFSLCFNRAIMKEAVQMLKSRWKK